MEKQDFEKLITNGKSVVPGHSFAINKSLADSAYNFEADIVALDMLEYEIKKMMSRNNVPHFTYVWVPQQRTNFHLLVDIWKKIFFFALLSSNYVP